VTGRPGWHLGHAPGLRTARCTPPHAAARWRGAGAHPATTVAQCSMPSAHATLDTTCTRCSSIPLGQAISDREPGQRETNELHTSPAARSGSMVQMMLQLRLASNGSLRCPPFEPQMLLRPRPSQWCVVQQLLRGAHQRKSTPWRARATARLSLRRTYCVRPIDILTRNRERRVPVICVVRLSIAACKACRLTDNTHKAEAFRYVHWLAPGLGLDRKVGGSNRRRQCPCSWRCP